MQSNYVKELSVKTYQEAIEREVVKSKVRPFHAPSFFSGALLSMAVMGIAWSRQYSERWLTPINLDRNTESSKSEKTVL